MLDEINNYLNKEFSDHNFAIGYRKEVVGKLSSIEPFEREIIEVELDDKINYFIIKKGMPRDVGEFTEDQFFENLKKITINKIEYLKKKEKENEKD